MRHRTVMAVLALAVVLLASAGAPGFAQGRKVPEALITAAGDTPQRVIVELASPAQGGRQEATHNPEAYVESTLGTNGRRVAGISDAPLVVAEVNGAGLRRLAADRSVRRVFPDRLMRAFLPESTKMLHVPDVWAHESRGSGAAVAILDTGVNDRHPFFKGRIVAEACFSSNVPDQGAVSLCPNGQTEQIGAGAATPCDPQTINEGCIHGTHVAGIAAGANGDDNGIVLNGVAPGANIVAVDVFTLIKNEQFCGKGHATCISAFSSDILRGMLYVERIAPQMHVASINLSLGGGKATSACDSESPYTDVFNRMTGEGIAIVVAAGNDKFVGAVSEPACVASAVTVTAMRKDGAIDVRYADSAPMVDLAAPGTEILSSAGNGYVKLSGTSMAAPHVAGLFALLRATHPNASVADLLGALQKSGLAVRDPRDNLTFDMPNAEAAEAMLDGAAHPAPTPSPNVPPPVAQQPAPAPDPRLAGCGPICVELGKTSRRVIFVLARHDPVPAETLATLRTIFGEGAHVEDIGDGKLLVEIPAGTNGGDIDRARRSTGDDTRLYEDRPVNAMQPGGRIQIR